MSTVCTCTGYTASIAQAQTEDAWVQEGTRRVAELHYKLALAQESMDQPEAALSSVKAAISILEKLVAKLRPAPAQPASFSFGVPDAADVGPSSNPAPAEDPKASILCVQKPFTCVLHILPAWGRQGSLTVLPRMLMVYTSFQQDCLSSSCICEFVPPLFCCRALHHTS